MAEQQSHPHLTDEQLSDLLRLAGDSDSVELKLTVPEVAQRSSVTALGMDPIAAQIRQVYFFDTPELALHEAGVVVRARRVQAKGDDSVVKLRPACRTTFLARSAGRPRSGSRSTRCPAGLSAPGQ
jgi:hypothetical protein